MNIMENSGVSQYKCIRKDFSIGLELVLDDFE